MLGLLPIVLLEIGLRVAGVGAEATDLHAGFGNVSPLFELNQTGELYRTSLAKEQFFVAQEFPAKKPEKEFRIFCLGGSTVQGRPYRPETSFGKWLELDLNARDTTRTYRSINCGGVSYASYRLRPVLKEVLNYQPDLIVLATGHNEFLEDRTYSDLKSRSGARLLVESAAKYSRTVMLLRKLTGGAPRQEPTNDTPSLSEGVEARLDDEAGYASYHRDDEWHDQVCAQYRNSVQAMVQMCRDADVPVLLVRLGANLRDCPPFKSEHKLGLSVEDEQRWRDLFDEATAAGDSDSAAALKLYQQALKIDDQYPLLHFRIARCQDELGNIDEANVSFQNALNADICPLRMISRISDDLLSVAESNDTMLVDAASMIAAASPDNIPGYESYIDHVHPTIGVHQLIGRVIADRLQSEGLVGGQAISIQQRRKVYFRHISQLGPAYFSNGRRRIGWLEGWARRQRLFDETLPVDARGYVATSIRYLDLHDYDTAGDNLQMAVAVDAAAAKLLLDHAAHLFGQGRPADAKWVLKELRRGKLNDDSAGELQLADLVLAVEDKNRQQVAAIYAQAENSWLELSGLTESPWLLQMPNVIQQAKSLITE